MSDVRVYLVLLFLLINFILCTLSLFCEDAVDSLEVINSSSVDDSFRAAPYLLPRTMW